MSVSKNLQGLGAWHEQQIARVLATPRKQPVGPQPEDILPPGEEMAPEEPSDILSRYVALLNRWGDLTARQAALDTQLAALQATAASLHEEWAQIRDEHQACLDGLETLSLPLAEVIREVWRIVKVQLHVTLEPNPRYCGIMSEELRQWLHALTLDPRGEKGA